MLDPTGHSKPPNIDRACLLQWKRHRRVESLRPLIERYAPFVYARCLREVGQIEAASTAARAVFIALARRKKIPKRIPVAAWLFRTAQIANRKSIRRFSRAWWRRWLPRQRGLDEAIDRLRRKRRYAFLLRHALNWEWAEIAQTLKVSETHAQRLVQRAIEKLKRHDLNAVTATPLPSQFIHEILNAIGEVGRHRPKLKLARRVLRRLAFERWRRRFALGSTICSFFAIIGLCIDGSRGFSWSLSQFIFWANRFDVSRVAQEAKPWTSPALDASKVRSGADLYGGTNVWNAHFNFTPKQWAALDPRRVQTLPHFFTNDGTILLRNPKAPRSGLAGVMGYAFDWSAGDLEFSGLRFTNAAIRIRGNVGALIKPKRPFKVDLNRNVKGQKLGNDDELNFNNLIWDTSCLRDTLGYEFFRDAGVPAPRTTFAWVTVSVKSKWDHKPLGLYLMVEPIDNVFAADRFGSKNTPIFKPVTYEFFNYLGEDWTNYAPIYDLKTKANSAQKRRIIDFARLLTQSNDEEFATHLGEYLDLDEFARFLACVVLIVDYDSILTTGQNFYMYFDPRSNRLGFIPWDLDAAWANFWVAKRSELERFSIWHPWIGKNRFLERVMAVDEFRQLYRGHLEDFVQRLLVADRIQKRIDQIAPFIRDATAAESSFRLDKFEQEIGAKPVTPSLGETANGINHPAYPYRKLIEARARSVRDQLDGKTKGMTIKSMNER
jgi:spore coat protein CotH/DNA-directed RNA polymerase specialized sigma24 family protein